MLPLRLYKSDMVREMLDGFELKVGEEAGCPLATTRVSRKAHLEQAVALVFGIDKAALDRPTRGRAPIAHARQAAM